MSDEREAKQPATFTPYHVACDKQVGPDESKIDEIVRKADEEEYGRLCPNCHEYLEGAIDIQIRPNPSGEPGPFALMNLPIIGTPR